MLEGINTGLIRLIAAYETEKARRKELEEELEAGKKTVEDCRKQIEELEKQIDNLNLRSALTGSSGSGSEAKAQIEKLVRKIDKCIHLLEG